MSDTANRAARRSARAADGAPTAAERLRTLLEFGSSVVLDVPGIDLAERPGIPRS
ncbi:hypothetical protein [Kitasatospora paranensis]|uniref:Uncharacterized protein n=1 Tax=Kitasatospora paranensis TaxID=258053 RepID=A0ABW2G9M4_9ACTN